MDHIKNRGNNGRMKRLTLGIGILTIVLLILSMVFWWMCMDSLCAAFFFVGIGVLYVFNKLTKELEHRGLV